MGFGLRHMAARKCDAQEQEPRCHRARGLTPTETGGRCRSVALLCSTCSFHRGAEVEVVGKDCRGRLQAQALWSLKEAKDKGKDCNDLGSMQKIQTRSQIRLDLRAIHLKSPTASLADALERTEQKSALARSSATSEL